MKLRISYLKPARVIISVLFLLAFLFIFLDFRKIIADTYFSIVTFLQFTPSLLKFISILSISAIGFILVLILTILFGRVYCSTLCPLGILQDIISRISIKFKKKKKRYYKFHKPYNFLRYGILIIVIITFISGSIALVNWLDPYSNFGRISTFFFKPILIWVNNLVSKILESQNIYFLYHVDQIPIKFEVYVIPLIIFGILLVFAIKKGRLFCNTICPVGALLGITSKISLFKIKINSEKCINCGLCERVCKTECIKYKDHFVDESRCISCFNCFKVCKPDAMNYNFSLLKTLKLKPDKEKITIDNNRRKIITGSLIYALGFIGLGIHKLKAQEKDEPIEIEKENPVSPPGSGSIEKFKSLCTACSLCVSACPTKVLQPSLLEYGILGIMQPFMDYSAGMCNYDCIKCTQVCPTGAILPLTIQEKQTAQLGVAKFILSNCIVYYEEKDCGACSEHCPTKAVHMVPYKNGLVIPEVTEDICIGCGACEYVCPSLP
ncbi:MAG: 4Fe-4S binding protein, partial [Bacteroidales bacterium]|nr:4Fe-4S binding protein [Bacteroidales bacterium]